MSETFERTKESVRWLQSRVREQDARRLGAIDAALEMGSAEDVAYINHQHRRAIDDLVEEIVRLRQMLPPWAEEVDGVVNLRPVTSRIDPMEEV